MRSFIDQHRARFGVEPICRVLQVAPSAYWQSRARQRDSSLSPPRARRDAALRPHIRRIWETNLEVYGADKVWHQLNREGVAVARCTVERLMRAAGLRGAVRGRKVRTTVTDPSLSCPRDQVQRVFRADRPKQVWVSDFTYVPTRQGFV